MALTFQAKPPLPKIPARVGATVIHYKSRHTGLLYDRRGREVSVRYYHQAASHEVGLIENFYTHETQHSSIGWAHVFLEESDREISVPPWAEARMVGQFLFITWLGAISPKPNSNANSDWFEVVVPPEDGTIQAIRQLEDQKIYIARLGRFY